MYYQMRTFNKHVFMLFCSRNNETGACLVDFDRTVTFSVSVMLEDCVEAKKLRYVRTLARIQSRIM